MGLLADRMIEKPGWETERDRDWWRMIDDWISQCSQCTLKLRAKSQAFIARTLCLSLSQICLKKPSLVISDPWVLSVRHRMKYISCSLRRKTRKVIYRLFFQNKLTALCMLGVNRGALQEKTSLFFALLQGFYLKFPLVWFIAKCAVLTQHAKEKHQPKYDSKHIHRCIM